MITPLTDEESGNECSTKAVVSAVSSSPSRQSTIILASDEGSNYSKISIYSMFRWVGQNGTNSVDFHD